MDFDEGLIKGKLTEVIFEEMFLARGEFDILPIGYEYNAPEVAENINLLKDKELIANLRHTPDFLIVSKDKKEAFLVEVKFRSHKDDKEVLEIAQKIHDRYGPSYLFLSTHEHFYFESCKKIIEDKFIDVLPESWIPKEMQDKYLALLNKYIH